MLPFKCPVQSRIICPLHIINMDLSTFYTERSVVQVQAPTEFQGTVIGDLNKRKGLILNSETQGDDAIVDAQVQLLPPGKFRISNACIEDRLAGCQIWSVPTSRVPKMNNLLCCMLESTSQHFPSPPA